MSNAMFALQVNDGDSKVFLNESPGGEGYRTAPEAAPPAQPAKGCGKGKRSNEDGGKQALERLSVLRAAASEHTDDAKPVELDLFDMKLGAEGAEMLAAELESDVSCPVHVLNLCKNKLGDEGAAAIAKIIKVDKLRSLRSIDLRMNKIALAGAERLGLALGANHTLTSLDISSNDFNTKAAACIALALESNTTLETLGLEYNTMADEGAERMALALSKNSTLTTLLMRSCEIRARGAASLARALAVNRSLKKFDISTNEFGDEGMD
eukprot:TRINITY_DN3054_c0_g1_i2.p1 TRINITY_DN3054_c0_g1~~TRINITY_DN3054_c0_g1_i2.p1  ORF type:complete len:267 (-),score=65.69 TRINITY_DN3054_c0_g1_i2:673-1473(-)